MSRTAVLGWGLSAILICSIGAAPGRADDRLPESRDFDVLLEGTERVETTSRIPAAFTAACRREYGASKALQQEIAFEPYLANRYFWAMEAMELRTGTYSLPRPGSAAPKPMCADGAFDGPLDPTVWTGAWTGGSTALVANSALPIATWTAGIVPNDNSISDQVCTNDSGNPASQAHHSIVPSGADPEFPTLATVAPTPTANPASLRLGNRCWRAGGERVTKTFPVVPGQTTLQFWYAMVFQNPSGHLPGVQPGFGAYLYDASAPVPNRIDLDATAPGIQEFVHADAANPFFGHKGGPGSLVVYSAWSCVTVDLSGLEGHTLTLILVNRDCGLGGHWGYTYVDSLCLGCSNNATGDATFDAAASDCVKGQLCFDYTVPTAANGTTGQVDLSLSLYQNGALVPGTPLTSGPLTASGTHCFTVPLSSLDLAAGGYDWSAIANFTLAPATISPIQIGSAPHGQSQTPGQNDDCRFPEPDPCATLVRKGRATGACGYELVLDPGTGEIRSVRYVVTTPGALVQTFSAGPCPSSTTPSTLANTTTGSLDFNPPCAQPVTLDVTAAGSSSGKVCLDLVVVVAHRDAVRECRTEVCFPCKEPPACPGTLCVYKFDDRNADGVQQIGEHGLPSVTFVLNAASGSAAVTTNASGVACTTLPPGIYTVVEQPQSGWSPTTATTQTVTVAAGQITDVHFGNRRKETVLGRLCVFKFLDANGNGRRERTGEPPLGGWTFEVTDATGAVVATLTTDEQGNMCTALPPGTYTVTEEGQAGYVGTTPVSQVVIVTAGRPTTVTFGNRKREAAPGKLCVVKFLDTNRSRRQEAGEPPLAGWTFEVTDASGAVVATLTTDAQGGMCTALPAGTYTVTETPQPGFAATTSPTQVVTVTAGQSTTVAFGNRRTEPAVGKLCVLKFLDTNRSRRQEAGEPPLAGWTFEVTDASGAVVATLTTDAQGGMCTALPAGTYTVTETPQPGFTATTPTTRVVAVTVGQTTTVTFGNRKSGGDVPPDATGKLCVHKFLDGNGNGRQDAGEPPLAGWTFQVRNAGGAVVATLTTDAQGTACTGLPAGAYAVLEGRQPGYAATTPTTQSVGVRAGETTDVHFGNRKGR